MNDEQIRNATFLSTAIRSISAGTFAGICGKFVEYPLDTVKVRMQTSSSAQTLTAWSCVKDLIQKDGFKGFYRGIGSPIAGAVLENSALFLLYEQTRKLLTKDGKPFTLTDVAISGAVAGLGTTTVLTPVELVKCKLQVHSEGGASSGVVSVTKQIFQEEGLRGFMRGAMATLARELPGNAVWFLTYEAITRRLLERKLQQSQQLPHTADKPFEPVLSMTDVVLAGGTAGALYWLVPYPLDTAKSLIQTANEPNLGLRQAIARIYAARGIRGLYNGLGVTMLRAFPSNACIFVAYTQFNHWIDYFFH